MTFREDGNYNSSLRVRLEACDTVVMMDGPTWSALWGIVSRQVRYGAGKHGRGRIHWGLIRYVAGYRRTMRPRVLEKMSQYAAGKQAVFLTSRAHTRRWLEQVAVRTS
ncbi:hypothetical protein GCM10022419_110830 [Nonomuraea rosea]|uniref:Topology modulation protein n=1 Tax=Nonomuraea rosea TaxID=638574 RepID=A0ABP6ZI36_9ACTN